MKLSDKEILFEDNHLLIVNKPSGLLTLPTIEVSDSVVERGKVYIKDKYQKPGNVYLHQAHRLDKAASGIVVLAKTSKALSRLNEQIRQGDWKKTYLIRTEKLPSEKSGEFKDYIRKERFHGVIVDEKDPYGKFAHLKYQVQEDGSILVDLLTGRYHQIRIQFSHRGFPICGDKRYGAKKKGRREGIDLHHMHLRFHHPVTKELLNIDSGRGGL